MGRSFRIAIGDCSARGANMMAPGVRRAVCELVSARIDSLRELGPEKLIDLPAESHNDVWLMGESVSLSVFHEVLGEDFHLIVVQAFRKTFARPNWISLKKVGQLVAEGLHCTATGEVVPAPDELLWPYR